MILVITILEFNYMLLMTGYSASYPHPYPGFKNTKKPEFLFFYPIFGQ